MRESTRAARDRHCPTRFVNRAARWFGRETRHPDRTTWRNSEPARGSEETPHRRRDIAAVVILTACRIAQAARRDGETTQRTILTAARAAETAPGAGEESRGSSARTRSVTQPRRRSADGTRDEIYKTPRENRSRGGDGERTPRFVQRTRRRGEAALATLRPARLGKDKMRGVYATTGGENGRARGEEETARLLILPACGAISA
jgi:hypothetical protein